jgi:putative PIN family toxin of toxin-antitoxin system
MITVVIDTNVFVGALMGRGGAARRVLRACLSGAYQPVMGVALFSEFEDVLGSASLWDGALLDARQRSDVLDGFSKRCLWVEVFFAWRPNLPDEGDNHLIELAIASNAAAIVTRNVRDLARGELRFPALQILTPEQCLEAYACPP